METRHKRLLVVLGFFVVMWIFLRSGPPDVDPTKPATKSVPAYDIREASQQQLALINEALDRGLSIKAAYRVRSRDHKRGWYVGGKILGPGLDGGTVAVWLIAGDPEKPGMILAADQMANEFSPVPHMASTDAGYPGDEVRGLWRYIASR